MSLDLTKAPQEQLDLITKGYCGRPTRNPAALGPYCKQNAGTRTDHSGEGACWLHGGNNRLKSGRYSNITRTKIRELIAEYQEDDNPMDTGPEIAAVRALLHDYIERYDEYTDALLAWYESYLPGGAHKGMIHALEVLLDKYDDEHSKADQMNNSQYQVLRKWLTAALNANPKPVQILDVSDAVRHLSEVTKMVERVGKLRNAQAISRKDFSRVMQEIGNIIDQCVTDDRTKNKIRDMVGTLRLA